MDVSAYGLSPLYFPGDQSNAVGQKSFGAERARFEFCVWPNHTAGGGALGDDAEAGVGVVDDGLPAVGDDEHCCPCLRRGLALTTHLCPRWRHREHFQRNFMGKHLSGNSLIRLILASGAT